MKTIKQKGQKYEGFSDEDIIYQLEKPLNESIDEILLVDLEKETVKFKLHNGIECDTDDMFKEGGNTYLKVDYNNEPASLMVKYSKLKEVVENALEHERDMRVDPEQWNKDIYVYHGMSRSDFL